ncbi:hypothetical protein KFK09_026747 [Dendrobium nobile]|uniref:DUF4283 domain-containing protein n=1 Tax=Dendrobium nobile TaxID=94219 RepID=A0A8T3A8Y3_DENNO|nr:hypothetical protein KFK09_026747 [Dendrobium nobile]
MDSSLPLSDFPPLSYDGGVSPWPQCNWKAIFASEDSSQNDLHLSHFPQEPEIIPFTGDKLTKGTEDWSHYLVGYSIGRRPYYEALLGAIKKTWNLKGSPQMLSLSDGFFLFRFACSEDLNMVWSKGV